MIYKSPKIHNFSNWSEHRYCQELRLFPCILLFELDQEKVFGEVLGRKVAILVYENINLKKIDFFHLFLNTKWIKKKGIREVLERKQTLFDYKKHRLRKGPKFAFF